jgi:hypothetical protein
LQAGLDAVAVSRGVKGACRRRSAASPLTLLVGKKKKKKQP